jgi:hypothetical protein
LQETAFFSTAEIRRKILKIIFVFILLLSFLFMRIHNSKAWFTSQVKGVQSTITTGDWSPPQTVLFIEKEKWYPVKENVINGGFEENLSHWQSRGNTAVIEEDPENKVKPPKDKQPVDKMLVISPSAVSTGGNQYFSEASQIIPGQVKNLSFWYNFATKDSVGFDNPGFTVEINGRQILQVWAEDVADLAEEVSFSGWRHFYYDLTDFNGDQLEIVFKAGNRGWNSLDSWVYIDEVSTNNIAVSSQMNLKMESTDTVSGARAYYKKGSCSSDQPVNLYSQEIQIDVPMEQDQFCYWSVDDYGNKEAPHQIGLIFDNQPPSRITDLQVTELGDEYGFSWTAPDPNDFVLANNQAAGYLFKYSAEPITTNDQFASAQTLTITAPRPEGEIEIIREHLGRKNLYFAVAAFDGAGNLIF